MYTDQKQTIQQSRTIPHCSEGYSQNLFSDRRPYSYMPSIQRVSIEDLKKPKKDKPVIKKYYRTQDELDVDFVKAKNAVKKMLKEYGINTGKNIDGIKIKLLDVFNFALYNCYNSVYKDENLTSVEELRHKINTNMFCGMGSIIQVYSKDLAFAGTAPGLENTMFINSSKEFQGGVHTIIHEIMHLLANKDTVDKLRTEDPMGDEAMNEIVARIASSELDGSIGNWNTTMENKSFHDGNTFYGKLIEKEKHNSLKGFTEVSDLLRYYLLGGKKQSK